MLYDLNIAWSPSSPAAELERTLNFAKYLGYDVVALNHSVSAPIPTTPAAIPNPIPQINPYLPTSQPNRSATASESVSTAATLPHILRRVTVTITDPSTTNYRLPDYARAYDLLALRPTTEKAFSWACLSTSEPPALISLELTSFLGWHIHHRTAMAAVQRGTRFEICYAQALQPSIDARQRSNFIGNVISLLRATKGRGIVVSSEARSALTMRGPSDVVNLLAVWGLGTERGLEAMDAGARAVVVNEGIKRRGFRGVVDIVQPAKEDEASATTRKDEAEKSKAEKAERAGKKQKGQTKTQGVKRKNGEGGQGEDQATISKRQAKKLRKQALQSGETA